MASTAASPGLKNRTRSHSDLKANSEDGEKRKDVKSKKTVKALQKLLEETEPSETPTEKAKASAKAKKGKMKAPPEGEEAGTADGANSDDDGKSNDGNSYVDAKSNAGDDVHSNAGDDAHSSDGDDAHSSEGDDAHSKAGDDPPPASQAVAKYPGLFTHVQASKAAGRRGDGEVIFQRQQGNVIHVIVRYGPAEAPRLVHSTRAKTDIN